MGGIAHPRNWKKVVSVIPVINEEVEPITRKALREMIEVELRKIYTEFHGERVALAFSGGIDSSVLAAILCKLHLPFEAVTIATDEDHLDMVYARKMARLFRFQHHQVIVPKKDKSDGVYHCLMCNIAKLGFNCSIHGDTINELLGGYPRHQWPDESSAQLSQKDENKLRGEVFAEYWRKLVPKQLTPVNKAGRLHGVKVGLPYLALTERLSHLPMRQRVDSKTRKIVLREIAEDLHVPETILHRSRLSLRSVFNGH